MVHINKLIEDSSSNHHKLLVLVGDQKAKKEQIIDYLTEKEWEIHDVEETVLALVEDIPDDKIYKRLGFKLSDWLKSIGAKVIFINCHILFSPEVKNIKPTEIFAYAMRGQKQGVLFLEGRLRDAKAIYSTPDRQDHSEMELRGLVFEKLENVVVGSEQ